ncbi:PEGA domain-containing protein [Candidatus Saccharibacteria bacterium]|nr:PEGA domain-containing protein [Candidatus Saccharibacteria bacterium]
MRKILDERERMERQQHRRLIFTEALMFVSVILLVGFLTLVVMGYSFNIRGAIDGDEEIVGRSGLVQVSSLPTGATIYIDGETSLLFNTNASRAVSAGEHEISLARGGFDGWKKTVNVTEGMMYRLNYVRLFREEREVEDVLEFSKVDTEKTGEVSFVTVSPNNERMILVRGGALYMVNLNENAPEQKTLDLTDAKGGAVKITSLAEAKWSGNSERLLAKVNGEWAVLNVREPKATVWLDEILAGGVKKQGSEAEASAEQSSAKTVEKVEISSIKFETEAGDRLLILTKKNELVELNVREKKLSEVLLEGVREFDNDGERVVYLTLTKEETTGEDFASEVKTVSEWQLRVWRVGEDESHVVKRFELKEGEELGAVSFSLMQYFQEFYVGVVRGGSFEVLKKAGWIMANDEMEELFTEEVGLEKPSLRKRGKGMVFEIRSAEDATKAKVFDIEALKTTTVDTAGCGWVDEFLRYRIKDGKLSVLDYDGLNERELVSEGVLTGRVVAISGNNRWLYYFVKMDEGAGEKLVRERIL